MKGTRDRPLKLDMDPDEAFERFLRVKPEDLPENVLLRRGKGGRPKAAPGVDAKPRKGRSTAPG